jgi:hypothetical protein
MSRLDHGRGNDALGIGVQAGLFESGRERTSLLVRKWDAEQIAWAAARIARDYDHLLDPHAEPDHRQFELLGVAPYDTLEWHGNLITQAGWAAFIAGPFGTTPTKFSATAGRIGIGSGTGPAAATDTALASVAGISGSGSNWKLTGSNPVVNTAVTPCTFVHTVAFGVNDAIGAWNEFAVDIGTASSTAGTPTAASVAPMYNHSAASGLAGTKATSQTWTATVTMSFT